MFEAIDLLKKYVAEIHYYYLNCLFSFYSVFRLTIFFMEQHCAHTIVKQRYFRIRNCFRYYTGLSKKIKSAQCTVCH